GSPGIKNTWESQVVDELKELAETSGEIVVKHRFSAFIDTRIQTLLRMKGINTLIVCGVGTAHCIESTVRDAYQLDFDVILSEQAVAGMHIEDHDASIRIMNKVFGLVYNQETVVDLIQGKDVSLD